MALLEGFDGCMVFGNTRNLIYLEIPSLISAAVSPAGQYLHTACGAPADAARPDLDLEFEVMLEELKRKCPGVREEVRFLVRAKHRGEAPGMRCWAGRCMPVDTPIRDLYNVGDGWAPSGHIGTEGAAASARAATEAILRR